MKHNPFLITIASLCALASFAFAEEREVTPEQLEAIQNGGDVAQTPRPAKLPDLTKGEEMPSEKFPPQLWYLGPTGITGFMVGGFPGDQFQVQNTLKGSPAEGKLQWGDVIIGMNGKKFTAGGHLGQLIGNAIIEAEKAENKGKISFLVWRDKNFIARRGKKDVNAVDVDKLFNQALSDNSLYDWKPESARKDEVKKMGFDEFPIVPTTLEIDLTLRVLPSYSDTAPYDCPKTKQILEDAWKVLEKKFAPDPKTGKPGRGGSLEALALVASGKPEHRKLVHDWVRSENCREWQPPKEQGPVTLPKGGGYRSWHMGFTGLNCALYYEATGDDYVVPALRTFAIQTAMGQSGGGSWGHTFAYPSFNGGELHKMNPGYGALNAAGNRCFFLIVLADKLGIKHPEIDAAIIRARRFFGSYVDQGCIPYGDHGAYPSDDSNGKNTGVAFAMKLLGDNYSAKYFAMMSTHASFTARGGHGHDYHGNWSAWAASLCGPEVRALGERNMRWRRTLCRLHDGSFVYISPTGRYGTLHDPTATEVLHQSAPLKQTLITGKDADESLWPTKREMSQLLVSAQAQFNDPWLDAKAGATWQKRGTDELFDLLDIFMPKSRATFAAELGKRFQAGEKEIAPRLIALLENENPRLRDAGLRGLLACGPDTVLGNLSKITKLLEDPKDFVRIAAVNVVSKSTENEEIQLAMLKATVADPQAAPPNSVRNATQTALFAKNSKLADSPFEAGFDEKLVQDALEKLITLDPVGGAGFVGSRKKVWTKDTVVRLAGPLVFAAEEEQIMDQMFANRSAPAVAMLGKFGYREGLEAGANRLRKKVAISRELRPHVGYKRSLLDPFEINKQPGAFRDLIGPLKIVLTDNPLEEVTIKDDRSNWKPVTFDLDDLLALTAASGGGAKLKLCRDALANPARKDTFRMIAAMDYLAETLGPDAMEDLLPYLGPDYWRLRDHATKLAGGRVNAGGAKSLAGLFAKTVDPATAGGILEVFAISKNAAGLEIAKGAMKHEQPLVRQSAIKTVFALGGDKLLPDVLAHLKQARDPADLRGCEEALLSRITDSAHAARVRDAVIAMLPESDPVVRPSLYYLIAQIGDAPSIAALRKAGQTKNTDELEQVVLALSYSPSREADKVMLELAALGPASAKVVSPQSMRRMVLGPKGYGDITGAERMDFADAMLNLALDHRLISYLGHIHEARALRTLASCLRKGAQSAAESLISSAEGMQKLPPADAEIAGKALQDVIEFIEITKLRGGMEKHMDKDDKYIEWKALQARAGKALLKIHKPGAAPILGFDPLELER
ncbi:MAG: DUF6288 domain-containing protein [Verrucomicrobia bacterium]|nr:DUF6288 domain-containing protein [Verrucomicrobiota bacterium]